MATKSSLGNPFHPIWCAPENSPTPDMSRWRIASRPRTWSPPTDIFETEDAIVVRMEIAGMQEANFSISLENRSLSIRGLRSDEMLERRAYLQMEIQFGEFRIDVELPFDIDPRDIEADYRDGFLRLILPKAHTILSGTKD